MATTTEVVNFGHDVRFRPQQVFAPANETELLEILRTHRHGKIRVMGSKHAWNRGIQTDDALIDLRHFQKIRIEERNGQMQAIVGGGCQIKTLLHALNQRQLMTPSIGLITEQTIAGATATGTHGSGKHSLSHYIQAVRVACYDETGESPRIVEITGGVELQAARCSLGCLGVVVEITIPVIPQYFVTERAAPVKTVEAALALEAESPLQQFYLFPHLWSYYVQQRTVAAQPRRRGFAAIYRIYWFLTLDVGMHLLILLFAVFLKCRWLTRTLFRHLAPMCLFPRWVVTDRSDRQLVMEHELFRHLEMELFVTRSRLVPAMQVVTEVLKLADNAQYQLSMDMQSQLQAADLLDAAESVRGLYCHHYPVCIRRILPDDTLISMASGMTEDWYAISFVTYVEPRDEFFKLASFIAEVLFRLFQARAHWGKWFPYSAEQVNQQYPHIAAFREISRRHDPHGVFRNRFVQDAFIVDALP